MYLMPVTKQRFYASDNTPLAFGKVYTYEAGSSTPKVTYIDQVASAANSNPILLNANGEADIWLTSGYYKIVVTDSDDVIIDTVDNVGNVFENSTSTLEIPFISTTGLTSDIITLDEQPGDTTSSFGTVNLYNKLGDLYLAKLASYEKLVTDIGTQVITNKDIDGGTAANTRRITVPKNTSTNLNALTRKAGTVVYDTTTNQFKGDNGSSLVSFGVYEQNATVSNFTNLRIVTSVASSALTVAIKTVAGNDPSPTDPISIGFISNGTYSLASITSPLSILITSGSTLGHLNNVQTPCAIMLINNAGTVELALSSSLPTHNSLINTTAEGGAGGADSRTATYTATARTNVPFTVVGYFLSNLGTAGAWNVNPTVYISDYATAHRIIFSKITCMYARNTTQSIPNVTDTVFVALNILYDSHSIYNTSNGRAAFPRDCTILATANIWYTTHTPAAGNLYHLRLQRRNSSGTLQADYYCDTFTANAAVSQEICVKIAFPIRVFLGDTLEFVLYQNSGAARTTIGFIAFIGFTEIG